MGLDINENIKGLTKASYIYLEESTFLFMILFIIFHFFLQFYKTDLTYEGIDLCIINSSFVLVLDFLLFENVLEKPCLYFATAPWFYRIL